MDDFYPRTLAHLLEQGWLSREMSILVVCGGTVDKEVLQQMGFSQVTISNLDVRLESNAFAPYAWSFQDAEQLKFGDGEFDFCIVHNGLHHCYSPHRALLEMYRVARKGILVFEPRDTFLVRLGVALNVGQEYEVAAVFGNNLTFGGVRNTAIPNYVYRWTERDIEKTICCYAPTARPRFLYRYALRVPEERLRTLKHRLVPLAVTMLLPLLKFFTWLFPRQSNCFAFAVAKPDPARELFPWLRWDGDRAVVNADWMNEHYRRK